MRSILFTLRTCILTSFVLLYTLSSYAQPGDFDCQYGTFKFSHPEGKSQLNNSYMYTSGTHTGKMILVGSTYEGSTAKFGICRVNLDGTLDTTFGTNGWTKADFFNYYQHPYGIALNSDNEIYIVGNAANQSQSKIYGAILKLTENGLKDTSFSSDGMLTYLSPSSYHTNFNDIIIQSDGKLVIGGQWDSTDDQLLFVRFNVNGTVDSSFGSSGELRMNVSSSGSFMEGISDMTVASDGDILATGWHLYSGTAKNEAFAIRITANGTRDTSFGSNGYVAIDLGTGSSSGKGIFEDTNGKIYIGGNSNKTHSDGSDYRTIGAVRLNADGTFDTSFSDDGKDEFFAEYPGYGTVSIEVHGSLLQSDGKFLVTGGTYGTTVARWDTDGNLDTTFSDDGYNHFEGHSNDWGYQIMEYGDRLYQVGWADDPDTGEDGRGFTLFRLFKEDVDMMYNQATTENAQSDFVQTGNDITIAGGKIEVCGKLNPFNISSLTFSTNGTTDIDDITSAKLYYSTTNSFTSSDQYGTTITSPNGNMVFTGTKDLVAGENYFWLVYSVENSATLNNSLDADFTSFVMDGTTKTPDATTNTSAISIINYIFLEGLGEGTCSLPVGWTTVDNDNDGSNWIITDDKNDLAYGVWTDMILRSGCMIASESYSEDTDTETAPENWLISSAIDLSSYTSVGLSYWISGFDLYSTEDEMTVLISTTTSDISSFSSIQDTYTVTGATWEQKNIDLSAYDGQTIYIAFKHEETTGDDMGWGLALDDIMLIGTLSNPNTPPTIATNNTLTLNEGGDGTITPNYLSASDVEEAATDLIFTVTTAAANGQLYLEDNNGRKAAATSVTQTDLNNNRVSYTHDGTNTTSDQIIFTLSDGKDDVTDVTFNISITAIDDTTPTLANNTGTSLAEGATANISSTQLLATDEDSEDTSLTFAISSLPSNGTLYKSGTALTTQSTFTNTKIDQLSYIHNHSNTTSDQFTFTVSDGTNTSTTQSFSITITPIDDTPPAVTNGGKTMNEGTTHTFTVTEFTASDEDSDDATLVFTVNSLPTNGVLKLNGTLVTVASTFNSSAIGNLTYEHNGDETTTDSFNFIVSDGTNTTSEQTFAWTISAVNDAPTVTTNTGKTVSHSSTHTFTLSEINASDTDNDAVDLYLIIDDILPTKGTLYLNSNALTTGSQVTLAEINSGVFTYSPSDPSATSDSFTFTVSDGTDASSITTFNYSITNQSPTVTRNNNQTVLVNNSYIFTTLVLNVTDIDDTDNDLKIVIDDVLPQSGTLSLNTTALTTGSEFSLQDLVDGNVKYQNNGATTTTDSFSFRVYDGVNYSAITVFNFTITQNAPPLVTVNTGKTTDEGSEFIIDNTLIFGSDADDADFVFMLATVPTNGTLYYQGTTVMEADNAFLQSSLINGDIKYVHNGSNTTSDSFTFAATDTKAVSDITTFSITITPVDDDTPILVNNTGNTINEGDNYLFTSTMLSSSDTDTDDTTLTYTLSSAPSQGAISLNGTDLTANGTFTTADISNALVRYTQNGSNSTADNFNFTVTDGTNTSVVKTFTTTITPVDDDVPYISKNTGNTIDEGGNYALSLTMLNALDNDTDVSNLTFTLSSIPSQGTLVLSGTSLSVGSTFNLSHLSDFVVIYTHNGSNSTTDNFNFTVTDGTNTSVVKTFTTTINPIDDTTPTLVNNTGTSLAEGATANISSTQLLATDEDSEDTSLTFAISSLPSNGTLYKSGTALTTQSTFTNTEIDQLSYIHNHSNTTSDQFTFTISDGTNTSTTQSFSITITPIDDTPPAVTNGGKTMNEGTTHTFTVTEFTASDEDSDDATLVFTVNSLPTNGVLKLNGTPVTVASTFNSSAIGNLTYEHNGDETTTDSFNFIVSDGTNTTSEQTFAWTISAVNDAPTVTTNTGKTVSHSSTHTFTLSEINASDTDNDAVDLYLIIDDILPTKGTLYLNSNALTTGSQVTLAEINSGVFTYSPSDPSATSDSFTFTVSDGTDASSITTFNYSITNQSPTVTRNNNQTVLVNNSYIFTTLVLNVTDIDDTDNDLKIVINDVLPQSGTLSLNTTALTTGSEFSLQDLVDGNVKYQNNGATTTTDSFSFRVYDGVNYSAITVFNFTITQNAPPLVTVNTGKTTDEGSEFIIDNTLIFGSDADDADFVFMLATVPTNGTLYYQGTTVMEADNAFLQSSLINGDIKYVHNGSNTTSDSFTFAATDTKAVSDIATFSIKITPVDDDTPILVNNTGNTINEGDNYLFTSTMLSSSDTDTDDTTLTYTLSSAPSQGAISLNGTDLIANGTFTTADISNALVRYTHNGSNSTADNFNFTVTDGTNTSVVKTFTTTITPVDDDVPYISKNTGNTIDEGGNYALSLTMLNALDNDTDVSNLTFTLSSIPSQGTLVLSGTSLSVGSTFNLSHLSDFVVIYTHNGSNSTTDNFNFTVTDGTNTSVVKTFTTIINPIDDDLPYITVNTGKTIDEGSNFTFSTSLLDVSDNDTDLSNLIYTLTAIPTNGNLTLSSTVLAVGDTFIKADVTNLVYQHNDSNTTSDQFAFTVSDGTNTSTEVTFAITITLIDDDAPSMVVENTSQLLEGATLNFSTSEFDATDDEIDNANIIVTITSLPVNGQLKNNGTAIAINETFLFGDIGNISYEHNDTNTTSDQFSFTLGDGINTTTAFTEQVIITAVDDDLPVLTTNTSLTLLEGDAAIISNTNLVAQDADSDNSSLIYTLISTVKNGRLSIGRKSLSTNSTFTQSQLNGAKIKYTHNGSNTVLDSIKIEITDGTQTSAIETFYFVINPIDDDVPIVTINTGATINEGGYVNLSTTLLAATDVDIDNNNLKFFIVDGVSNGKMSKGRKRYNSGSYFTLSDIANGSIKYTHDHSNTIEDSFTFYVSDGTLSSSTQRFTFTLNAIDDDIPEMETMTDLFLHIDSADVMITHDDLHFSDDLSSTSMISYQVIDAPAHGLLYNTSLAIEVDNFTQNDIDNNIIQYQLIGEDISADEFSIMVSDSVNNTSSMFTVIIDIMAEDDFTNIYAGTINATSNASSPVSKQLYHSLYLDQIPMETNLRMLTTASHGTISYGTEVFTDSTNFRIERILTDSIMYNAQEVDVVTYDSVLFIIEHALTDDKIYQVNFKISPDAGVTALVEELDANVKAYPMPFDNALTIESDLLFNRYRLLSNTGHLITQDAFDMVGRKNINIGTIASGVYLLELTTKEGIIHKKIVKK
ncbi:T9SS type A sorting domain-containing protein [Flammeovirga pectinis]|uniref:T9SS type A sorting domain-containing protein n=1 Tax=Flammeovirga pectinis TaxID=2494373 RepID=A0A3S9NY10_9BACT|nr:cadherin-like domain-containing protein [Flammeovirga pectinis]AZQ60807.1 T9SS type A sorting domain-containing protein [Flammeovirga pectinis]